MLRKILTFFHKETVLSISAILAILSMFIVHPSGKYFSYIDFRTLSLLFCLMSIVAGLSEIGLFDYLAEKILSRANSIKSIIVLLVLLCFFFSMIQHTQNKSSEPNIPHWISNFIFNLPFGCSTYHRLQNFIHPGDWLYLLQELAFI